MKTLFMETTAIEATRTQADLQSLLCAAGATEIRTRFENSQIVALAFAIEINGRQAPFSLPCRWEAIYDHLVRKKPSANRDRLREQAIRVAWRQLLRWTQAQLALTDTGMAKVEEVFLPYMQNANGSTLFEELESGKFKMLEAK